MEFLELYILSKIAYRIEQIRSILRERRIKQRQRSDTMERHYLPEHEARSVCCESYVWVEARHQDGAVWVCRCHSCNKELVSLPNDHDIQTRVAVAHSTLVEHRVG